MRSMCYASKHSNTEYKLPTCKKKPQTKTTNTKNVKVKK